MQRVNDAGDGWIQIPGWVVAAIEPTGDLFEGMGWFDTNVDQLKIYDGSDFVPLAGGLSPDDLHNLALLQGLIDKTADLELRSEREWIAATDAALLVTSGRPTGPSLPNETYVTTFTYTSANIAERYLVLRVPHAANISHYRLDFHQSRRHRTRPRRQPLLAPLYAIAVQILRAELYQQRRGRCL